jgi:hypothetical protein
VGKAEYNHPHTRATIEPLRPTSGFRRICGFARHTDIPSESTLSRAFAEFAELRLDDKVHEAMVEHFAKPGLVGYISRAATALEGRETPVVKGVAIQTGAPEKRAAPAGGSVGT